MTLVHWILADHLVDGRLVAGEEVQLGFDQALLQDATGTMACLQLEQLGVAGGHETVRPDLDSQAAGPILDHFEALGVDRIRPNVLARQFAWPTPHQAWVTDITYLPTGEGWLYWAVIVDLCSRFAVGWALNERITDDLTVAALGMPWNAGPPQASGTPGRTFAFGLCQESKERTLRSRVA